MSKHKPHLALTDDQLREAWYQHASPLTHALLWEIRRLRDENKRLADIYMASATFARALHTRGGVAGDPQLQVFWNRARILIDEFEEYRQHSR
jgi:hypothetical protein